MAEEKHLLYQFNLLEPQQNIAIRRTFVNAFFDLPNGTPWAEQNYSGFFHRYENLCTLATNKTPEIAKVTLGTLCQVRELLSALIPVANHGQEGLVLISKDGRGSLLKQLSTDWPNVHWQGRCVSTPVATSLLDLCASLYLMVAIGSWPG